VLRAMEEAGQCRRGYFVEGLGAAQFALPGAVDRMRAMAAAQASASGTPALAPPFPGMPVSGTPVSGMPAAGTPLSPPSAPQTFGSTADRPASQDGVPGSLGTLESPSGQPHAMPASDGPGAPPALPDWPGTPTGGYGVALPAAGAPSALGTAPGPAWQAGQAAPGDPAVAEAPTITVLAAADPANAFGAALPWPPRPGEVPGAHRPGRKAGALVVLSGGDLVLYVERGGKTLLSWTNDPAALVPAAEGLAAAVRGGALGRLTVERADGTGVYETPLAQALADAGFRPTPRGLRLRN